MYAGLYPYILSTKADKLLRGHGAYLCELTCPYFLHCLQQFWVLHGLGNFRIREQLFHAWGHTHSRKLATLRDLSLLVARPEKKTAEQRAFTRLLLRWLLRKSPSTLRTCSHNPCGKVVSRCMRVRLQKECMPHFGSPHLPKLPSSNPMPMRRFNLVGVTAGQSAARRLAGRRWELGGTWRPWKHTMASTKPSTSTRRNQTRIF